MEEEKVPETWHNKLDVTIDDMEPALNDFGLKVTNFRRVPLLKEDIEKEITTGSNFNTAQIRFLKDLPSAQNPKTPEQVPPLPQAAQDSKKQTSKISDEEIELIKDKLASFGVKTNSCSVNKLLGIERELDNYFRDGSMPSYFIN